MDQIFWSDGEEEEGPLEVAIRYETRRGFGLPCLFAADGSGSDTACPTVRVTVISSKGGLFG